MRYISNEGAGWDHRSYWPYLTSVRGAMPRELYAFAADPQNHDLESPNSLHDAWLESWIVKEMSSVTNVTKRAVCIECRLLGPRHDRTIHLTYDHVLSYGIHCPSYQPHLVSKGHGDLLVHEVQVVRENVFSHELLFSSGTSFFVEFVELKHQITTLPNRLDEEMTHST
jgi:hypothetical protein